MSLLLGASFGLMFGLLDVEDDKNNDKLIDNTIYGVPIGLFPLLNCAYFRKVLLLELFSVS